MNPRLDAYRPAHRPLPAVVHHHELSTAERHALLRDGVLRPLWGRTVVAADLVETPALRAAALAPLVCPGGVVGRTAAAWVHTGRPLPGRVDVLVPPGVRRATARPGVRTAQATLEPGDVVRVGGLAVTSVQRTGLDVARWLPAPAALAVLRALLSHGFDVLAALDRLDALAGQRGVRAARHLLGAPALRDPHDPFGTREPADTRRPLAP